MKSGPKPTPTALRELRGNPGRRPLPVNEPEPSGLEEVDPPAHLSTEAKREWRRLAPELIRLRLLTVADFAAFTGYCSAWSDFIEADRVLASRRHRDKGQGGAASPLPVVLGESPRDRPAHQVRRPLRLHAVSARKLGQRWPRRAFPGATWRPD